MRPTRRPGVPIEQATSFELVLVDQEGPMVAAWRTAFAPFPEVAILHADMLAVAENTVVSPANSYGYMDGGIDRAYIAHFGTHLQATVSEAITRCPEGSLSVGASLVVPTGHLRIPYLIVSPTMTLPGPIRAVNCYYAMRSTLQLAARHIGTITRVFCPGFGTGVGQVAFLDAAREMALAYQHWKERK
jgi:O-acetyl-ADP-ribose deacetylase (regulator of RNase III)